MLAVARIVEGVAVTQRFVPTVVVMSRIVPVGQESKATPVARIVEGVAVAQRFVPRVLVLSTEVPAGQE